MTELEQMRKERDEALELCRWMILELMEFDSYYSDARGMLKGLRHRVNEWHQQWHVLKEQSEKGKP